MPGRPRKERRRDPSEVKKKGTKLTKVGSKIKCTLCRTDKHNRRRCPLNPEKGKKNVTRERMQAEVSSQHAESSQLKVRLN